MAKVYEDDCVGCEHCIGCGRRNYPHYYCDGEDCREEFSPDELYDYDGDMLCEGCLLKKFQTIEEKEC